MPSLRYALSPQGCPYRGRATLREGMAREGSQSPHVTEQGDTDFHLKFGDPWSKNGVKRKDRLYNELPTREQLLEKINTENCHLYWLDALGVEYLSVIEYLAEDRGLALNIQVARSELPTITLFNRQFFDEWKGSKDKNDKLDRIKHDDHGGYSFLNNELPVYLAGELEVIKDVIENAATALHSRKYNSFLIVSDHGASRLAVLRSKEEKYDTDTQGKHSGRCCKTFEGYDLPFAAEENGYIVLADYGRFKGSRAANVEVHGGASLEEVVIPIIELTLKDKQITVEVVNKTVFLEFKKEVTIELFFTAPVSDVSVRLGSDRYSAESIEDRRFRVLLSEIKKADHYTAEVYSGDTWIGKVAFKVQSKIAQKNEEFDNFF